MWPHCRAEKTDTIPPSDLRLEYQGLAFSVAGMSFMDNDSAIAFAVAVILFVFPLWMPFTRRKLPHCHGGVPVFHSS
jgi:hypothetical protein